MSREVGSRIHLTSISEIRYEGLLHNIDIDGNTVSLTNVSIFGTEGRKNGVDEVPPSNEVFDVIVFRGSDIKDLTLFDEEKKTDDPAIVSATRAQPGLDGSRPRPARPAGGGGFTAHMNPNGQMRDGPGRGENNRAGFYDNHNGGGNGGNHQRRGGRHGGGGRRGGDFYPRPGNQGHNDGHGHGGNRNGGGGHRNRQEGHTGKEFRVNNSSNVPQEDFKEAFDFSRGREEFEKTKKEFEGQREESKQSTKAAYSKSSGFFDTISCDQKENRMGREEMKKADTETFGSEMVGSMRGFRRRNRYRR